MHSKTPLWHVAGLAAFAALTAQSVHAAGFAVHEQSTSEQGDAYAGVAAGGEDVSSAYFNPAALALFPGKNVAGGFSVITGNVSFSPQSASTAFATPITGGDGGNLIKTGYVPALAGSWQLDPEWFIGLSINAPYGFETEADSGWIGRYHALGSRLRSVEISPMVAWKPVDWVSFGAGFRAMYIDARLSSAIDIGTASGGLFTPGDPANDSLVSVKGSDWAYGFTLGTLLTPLPGFRVGIGYRSKMDVNLKGDADFTLSPAGQALSALSGQLVDTGASAAITLPQMITFGVEKDIGSQWTVGAEADWTQWSKFKTLTIQFDNPLQAADVTNENWRDSWFLSLGATYRPDDRWILRTGVAYDEGIDSSSSYRTPRIPDSDRYWASLGAGYKLTPSATINAGYTHIFAPNSTISQSVSDPNNQLRGNLSGTVDASADVINVGFSTTF
ncbi:MAG: porin [Parvibaculum sp.]|uniref:OmpP1/FadL family transporter n=1 Tax=Parvibaculum sp. TaxID=2024848 RepID=UPI00283E8090|nr:outer membrane protein transport protein [Parvibaculum sp.]MDR3498649.1 porin [Parvibaculum sp.]